MVQTSADAKLTVAAKTATPVLSQARLILQDPLAFDQATQPALRSSMELAFDASTTGLEREKARDLWESLSLEPEVAQEKQTERKRQLLRSENLVRESAAAKAQAIELQAQLAKAHDERLYHPAVYAGAVGLLGLGALWLLERRKRMALQERELGMLAEQSPSLSSETPSHASNHLHRRVSEEDSLAYVPQHSSAFSLEDSPYLADDFATDLPGLSAPAPAPPRKTFGSATAPAPLTAPLKAEKPCAAMSTVVQGAKKSEHPPQLKAAVSAPATPDWALSKSDSQQYAEDALQDMSWETQDRGLLSIPKRVLGSMLRRRSKNDAFATSSMSHMQTEVEYSARHRAGTPSTFFHEQGNDAMQMLYDDEAQEAFEQELLEQQLSAGLNAGHNPDQANIELLSKTRVSPLQGESAIEHLLELRTAVNGLYALSRPEGAAKLLLDHITADRDTCAWAYLEFMQVSEQIGWREEFETVRKNYRQQFNRMAPYWHEPNSNVLGLDGYARATNELCTAWSQGVAHSQRTLASWLIGPLLSRKLVQLPAYHDLFDLYEMLEFMETPVESVSAKAASIGNSFGQAAAAPDFLDLDALPVLRTAAETGQEYVPTVSLLELDYEFSSDVTLDESQVRQAEKSVTTVKPGHFSVDFNVAGTQLGVMPSLPAQLAKK